MKTTLAFGHTIAAAVAITMQQTKWVLDVRFSVGH